MDGENGWNVQCQIHFTLKACDFAVMNVVYDTINNPYLHEFISLWWKSGISKNSPFQVHIVEIKHDLQFNKVCEAFKDVHMEAADQVFGQVSARDKR